MKVVSFIYVFIYSKILLNTFHVPKNILVLDAMVSKTDVSSLNCLYTGFFFLKIK